jgi:RNA polymerase sigma factor (sigma-70 family)
MSHRRGPRHALLRYRAERLLRSGFSDLRPRVIATVRARLGASGVRLDAADLDACYASAWHGLYATLLQGEQIEDLSAWLVLVTFRRAIDEFRARVRQQAVYEARGTLGLIPELDTASRARDLAAELDDRDRLRQLLEALNGRLTPRERRAASLCYLQGLSRSQAARRLGLSEGRMRKLMDGSPGQPGVAAKMSALLETIDAGRWCEQQGSLMRAYAFGVLDPDGERHRLALAHLRECPACRAFVLSLRGLAAILPPPPLSLQASGGMRAQPESTVARWIQDQTRSSAAPIGNALVAKLAVVGAVTLAVGGGYALHAGGARGHAVHPAPTSRTPSVPAQPKFAVPARPTSVGRSAHRRRSRTAVLHSGARPRPPAPPPALRAPGGTQGSGSSSPVGALGEFTPERPSPRPR